MCVCLMFVVCLLQGELNKTVIIELLDDATPEDQAVYKVTLSNLKTFGNSLLLVSF